MKEDIGHTQQLQNWIDRIQAGDEDARIRLIEHACERLRLLARKMMHRYSTLRRWEETDDVFVEAMTRLARSLETVQIESPRHFYNLAASQIRRVLIDMKRHYFGPLGIGANHGTAKVDSEGNRQGNPEAIDKSSEPQTPEQWLELYEHIEALPDLEREICDLMWFGGMTQNQIAEALGISERTVRRRWQDARIRLHNALSKESLD